MNIQFFLEQVLPSITASLSSDQLFEIAKRTKSDAALTASGYRLWRSPDMRICWIPKGHPLEQKAAEVGASVVEDATAANL